MSLRRIHENRVFDDATTDERRARVYVGSGEFGFRGDERPEVKLMRALAGSSPPQRLHVVGPSGAGKTSLILRVVVDRGDVDEESVENLYHHGVRALGEMPVDLIVAMHPRFETVDRVREVSERIGMPRIEVPELPPGLEEPVLGQILERRMRSEGLDSELGSVIERAAVEDLQVLYHDRESNLRSVLRLAHEAAEHALTRGSEIVAARDVREVVARAAG
jgi:hypothetical protein